MELTSRVKMARFQTFWIQVRKNKPLDKSHKTSQTSGTKMTFLIHKSTIILKMIILLSSNLVPA
ncbi:hypothetical protein Hanom_Chr12g01078861 [Helianthus anomalus]